MALATGFAAHTMPVHLLASTRVLVAIMVGNLVVLALRMLDLRVAVQRISHLEPAHAARRRRRRRARTSTRRLAVVAAVTMVIGHAAVAVEIDRARATLVDVFPIASQPATTVSTAARSGTATPRRPAPPSPAAVGPVDPDVGGPDGFLDVLLIGLDAGAGRQGARNDANMVVRVDPSTAQVMLIGVPRNLVRLPMPSSADDCRCFRSPLFALYRHGLENPAEWPDELDPGAAAVRDSLEAVLGLRIDGYVVADMGAFLDLVDVLGGVEVAFSGAIADQKSDPFERRERIHLDVGPGVHRLDGAQALTLARSRRGADDYVRMERQRCLVGALSAPAAELGVLDIVRLSRSVRGRLVSDVSRDELPGMVALLQRVERRAVTSIGLVPPAFTNGYEDGYPLIDVHAVRAAVHAWPAEARPSATPTSTAPGVCS